jgi:hypothetical protein
VGYGILCVASVWSCVMAYCVYVASGRVLWHKGSCGSYTHYNVQGLEYTMLFWGMDSHLPSILFTLTLIHAFLAYIMENGIIR